MNYPDINPTVQAYSVQVLLDLLAHGCDRDTVKSKSHFDYFEKYFQTLAAKTVVVEDAYVDHDYLDDFAAFYVRCFSKYERFTRRLHFFTVEFGQDAFDNCLKGTNADLEQLLANNYLGFVVVKPLPRTIIGRTCLATYPSDDGRRNYPITQRYTSNLCGIELSVQTLAFQEQDSVVSACATSALWSAFQGTGKLFHHRIPSPAEITKCASDHISDSNELRRMPNGGLTAAQMAHSVRAVGLEPYLLAAENQAVIKNTVYAYLSAGIPLILLFELHNDVPGAPCSNTILGMHAVAITGFSLGGALQPHLSSPVQYKASRIDKFYAHDDQVGPFTRMELRADGYIDSPWGGAANKVIAKQRLLLIPLNEKIRLSHLSVFSAVQEIGSALDRIMRSISSASPTVFSGLEWDVRLVTANSYKKEIFSSSHEDRDQILRKHFPRYLWCARVLGNDRALLDIIFDATDIEQSGAFVCHFPFDKVIHSLIKTIFSICKNDFLGGSPLTAAVAEELAR